MGIQSIVNACSHLQNASRARLAVTSIPSTKYNLALALALHRAGFVSSVTRGGPEPPENPQSHEPEPVTAANVATRRLWLGLKYWNNQPVMRRVQPISKPSRLITLGRDDMGRVARGFPSRSGYVKGLNLGECLFVSTDQGVMEVREALEKDIGGLILCRVI